MAVINVGETASDRGTTRASGTTYVNYILTANATGTITSVEMWANGNIGGCKVATWWLASGADNLTARDVEVIGDVTAGSKQTFSGLNMDIETDDYIGLYFTSGTIETDTSGCGGLFQKAGDQTACVDVDFSQFAGDAVSLFGIGSTDVDGDVGLAIFFSPVA